VDLLGITLKAVDRAFAITKQFQAQVTFQLEIVWNLDPVNDTANPVPTFTKTVLAVVYKPVQRRIDLTGAFYYTENICVRQWEEPIPAPSQNDRVLITDQYGTRLRQIEYVTEDPAHAIWICETRLPTQHD
jgi:hypothetical protein